jgi:hypothetical protein
MQIDNFLANVKIDLLSRVRFETTWKYILLGDREKDVLSNTVRQHLLRKKTNRNDEDEPNDEAQLDSDGRLGTASGKKNGLLVLFHGPPASGKRSAVGKFVLLRFSSHWTEKRLEALADNTKRPLITLTPSELPSDAVEATARVKSLLYLASRWTAILQVQEADFLFEKPERESRGNLGLNPLRAAFLREVQYFDSVMIMTTARIGWADEEVLQIIHLPIYFRELNNEGRTKVWQMMLKRCGDEDDIEVEYDTKRMAEKEWSKLSLNAKQIRNCLVVAVALAKSDRNSSFSLETSHVKEALGMTQEFMKYMTDTQGGADANKARDLRDDQFTNSRWW